jgi:hypothetical protein
MDARVAVLVKAHGLRFNPFQRVHSEGDPHLPEMFVRMPCADQKDPPANFIYGEDGSGKTALCLHRLMEHNEQFEQRRVLAVPFRAPARETPDTHFVAAMAQAITATLFTTALTHPPAFNSALAARLVQAFDLYLDLPDWRAVLAGADQAEGVTLMYDLVNMPRLSRLATVPCDWHVLADWPPVDGNAAADDVLVHLFDLAHAMGARSCLVLADNLGAPGRDVPEVAEWAARIWSLRGEDGLVDVQLFLPLTARDALEARLGRHTGCFIQWDAPALREMLARRLQAAGSDALASSPAGSLLDEHKQIELIAQAQSSPRRLIGLISEHLAKRSNEAPEAPLPASSRRALSRNLVNQDNALVFQKPEAESHSPQSSSIKPAQHALPVTTGWLA